MYSLRCQGSGVAGNTASHAGLRGIPGLTVIACDHGGNPMDRAEPIEHHATMKVWVRVCVRACVCARVCVCVCVGGCDCVCEPHGPG